MGIQYIIMYAVVAVCIILAGIHFYHKVKDVKEGKNPCDTCNSDCALRNIKGRKCPQHKHKGSCCCD